MRSIRVGSVFSDKNPSGVVIAVLDIYMIQDSEGTRVYVRSVSNTNAKKVRVSNVSEFAREILGFEEVTA